MDLSTKYLGLELENPVMPGASPLCDDLDTVKRLEDAGAPAVVMRSLFEEQLTAEQAAREHLLDRDEHAFAEALSAFPGIERFGLGPDDYLGQLRRIKGSVGIPVIASLNGVTPGGWLNFARLIEEAGADALELNVYYLATDADEPGRTVEQRVLEMLETLRPKVLIPLAVKLSPFYSALANFARDLDASGADGLVLFNRFYQPDIDVEEMLVQRRLYLSDPRELLLRLRWLAILSGRLELSLAASGGVRESMDVIKAVMAGADAVQVVSELLRDGPGRLEQIRLGITEWLDRHGYDSLNELRGSMSLDRCPDPLAYERANYMEVLQDWNTRAD